MSNIFDELYDLIDAFVCDPMNSRLKAGTGRYSTPFRGTLFGSTESVFVEKVSKEKSVKVLWLGSNPNVPKSLDQILDENTGSDYHDFVAQKQSGHFSEIKQNGKPGWDPINNPDHNWGFYMEIFKQLFGQERILMANYVPWGSENFSDLMNKMRVFDEQLLERMLQFSTMMSNKIIEYIKPEIVVVPKSIWRSQMKHSHLFVTNDASSESYRVEAQVPFEFTAKEVVIGNNKILVLISPHPSYTSRVGMGYRQEVQSKLIKVLRRKS